VTLNDDLELERVIAVILRYFAEFGSFGAITSKWLKTGILSATKMQSK